MELYIKTKEGISKANFVKTIESDISFVHANDCEIHSSENLFNEFKNIVLGQKIRRIETVSGFDSVINFSRYEQLVTDGKLEGEGFKYIQNVKKYLSNSITLLIVTILLIIVFLYHILSLIIVYLLLWIILFHSVVLRYVIQLQLS